MSKPNQIQYRGVTWSIVDLARQVGMNRYTLRDRLHRGMSVEEAISKRAEVQQPAPSLLGQLLSKPWTTESHHDA